MSHRGDAGEGRGGGACRRMGRQRGRAWGRGGGREKGRDAGCGEVAAVGEAGGSGCEARRRGNESHAQATTRGRAARRRRVDVARLVPCGGGAGALQDLRAAREDSGEELPCTLEGAPPLPPPPIKPGCGRVPVASPSGGARCHGGRGIGAPRGDPLIGAAVLGPFSIASKRDPSRTRGNICSDREFVVTRVWQCSSCLRSTQHQRLSRLHSARCQHTMSGRINVRGTRRQMKNHWRHPATQEAQKGSDELDTPPDPIKRSSTGATVGDQRLGGGAVEIRRLAAWRPLRRANAGAAPARRPPAGLAVARERPRAPPQGVSQEGERSCATCTPPPLARPLRRGRARAGLPRRPAGQCV